MSFMKQTINVQGQISNPMESLVFVILQIIFFKRTHFRKLGNITLDVLLGHIQFCDPFRQIVCEQK